MSDIDRERAIELIELMMREYEENECMVCEITFGDEELEALRFARDSLKVDEAYQLEYERTTKQEPILDRVRAEIEQKIGECNLDDYDFCSGLICARKIIDKYKSESEDNNG